MTKLKGARDRKRRETGQKVEGRKSYAERDAVMVATAKRLRGRGPRPAMSLREIAAALHAEGYGAMKGGVVSGPLTAMAVKRMLDQRH